MLGGHGLDSRVVRRHPVVEEGGVLLVALREIGLHGRSLRVRHAPDAPPRLVDLVLRLRAETGYEFGLVGALLVGVEPREQLLGSHRDPSLSHRDRAFYGRGKPIDPVAFEQEGCVVLAQDRGAVDGAREDAADRIERQVELAQEEHLLQPQQRVLVVVAVAVGPDVRRRQQPEVVIVPERA